MTVIYNKDTISLKSNLVLLNRVIEVVGLFTLSKGVTYPTIVHLKPINAVKYLSNRIVKAIKLLNIRIFGDILLS